MTNFEWLVSKDKLRTFVIGLHAEKYDDFITHWEIPRTSESFSESISNWLTQEHQEPKPKEYVLLEDVVTLLNAWRTDGRISQYIYIESALRSNLKVKEIDDGRKLY